MSLSNGTSAHQGPGPVDIATVAKRTSMPTNDAGRCLTRLAKSGVVVKVGRGMYEWPGRLRDQADSVSSV
jgi:hypothetical protein